jgi:uncharacterized protein YgiM (DUF1202 family)
MADIDSGGNKNFTFMIMKTNCWLVLGMMVATSALAQNTNTLPPIPAPAVSPAAEVAPADSEETNAPAAKPAKHKKHHAAPKKAALNEPTVALLPGTAEVTVSNLNVRGQAGLQGEVISHLVMGDTVTVISQIDLDKHSTGEPAQWAKIALPPSTKIWLNEKFIDATSKTVLAKKLNLRAGPGENFSVLGVIERGTPVNKIGSKGDWAQIDPPTNAYAFVAAIYLKQEASGTSVPNAAPSTETEPMPAPVPTPIAETPAIVTQPTPAAPSSMETNSSAPMVAATPEASAVDTNPPPPRVVSHEGVVGPVSSLIAPTAYVLYDLDTRKDINFLYTTSTNLDISRYSGMRIIVTGEEGLVPRWPDTPLLTIQSIEVLETNAIPKVYYPSPRQRR